MTASPFLRFVLGAFLVATGASAFATDALTCGLFLHALDSSGAPLLPALVTPDDVASSRLQETSSSDFQLWYFKLTEPAARRMSTYSSQNIGRPLAISCGSEEVSLPIIRTMFSAQVVVSRPVHWPVPR